MAGRGRKIVVEFLGEDRTLSATARKVEGTTGKLGGRLAKVGMVAGGVLATGLAAAGAAAVQMGKNAAEDEAAQRRLAVALQNTAGATRSQVADVEKWISAQGKALGVTDDKLRPAFQRLVQATGDVGEAQRLAGIAMDASAGSGKSLETVSTAIAKAQNGNMGALSRLGVQIKDTDGKTLSFNEAMKEMSKTFGGQAAAQADSFQGKMDRLRLMFDETKEAIGAKLIPVAEKFAGWILDEGLPAATALGKYLQGKFGPVIDRVRGFLANLSKDSGQTSSKFGKFLATVRSAMKSVGSIISSVVSIVRSLWKAWGDDLTKFAGSAFSGVLKIVSGGLRAVAGVFKVIASVMKGDWKGAWDGIKQIVSGAWSVIKGLVQVGWAAIRGVFGVGASAVKAIFKGAWDGLKSIVSSGISGVVNLVKAVPGKITAIGGAMKNAGKALMQKMLDGISTAAGFVGNFASGVWNKIKGLLNKGIDKINAALDFSVNIPLVGKVRINAPNIPHLYRGGVVPGSKAGTLAVLGDRGHDEAVIPLSGPHAPNLGGGDIRLTVYLDSEVVHRSLVKRKRTLGRDLGLA